MKLYQVQINNKIKYVTAFTVDQMIRIVELDFKKKLDNNKFTSIELELGEKDYYLLPKDFNPKLLINKTKKYRYNLKNLNYEL